MFNDFFHLFLLLLLIEDDINTDLGEAKLLPPRNFISFFFLLIYIYFFFMLWGRKQVSRENSILMCKIFHRNLEKCDR